MSGLQRPALPIISLLRVNNSVNVVACRRPATGYLRRIGLLHGPAHRIELRPLRLVPSAAARMITRCREDSAHTVEHLHGIGIRRQRIGAHGVYAAEDLGVVRTIFVMAVGPGVSHRGSFQSPLAVRWTRLDDA